MEKSGSCKFCKYTYIFVYIARFSTYGLSLKNCPKKGESSPYVTHTTRHDHRTNNSGKNLNRCASFPPFAPKTWEVLWWPKKVPNWFSENVTPPPFAAQQFAAAHSPSTPLLFYSNRIVPVTQIRKRNFREWKRSEKATMAQRRKLIAKWGGGGGDAEIAFLFTVALLCLTITILVFCSSIFTVLFVVGF